MRDLILIVIVFASLIIFSRCKNPVSDRPSLSDKMGDSLQWVDSDPGYDFQIGRLSWQKPYLVINMLGDLTGKTVADIGAGAGYFSFKLIDKAGKVIAIDIDPQAIDYLEVFKMILSPEKRQNFETRLVTADDPMLVENEVDVIIIVNTIAFIENRVEYLRKLKKALKPGGQLLINDFKMRRLPEDINAPNANFRIPINVMENELQQAGFADFITDDTSLDYQYIILAAKD